MRRLEHIFLMCCCMLRGVSRFDVGHLIYIFKSMLIICGILYGRLCVYLVGGQLPFALTLQFHALTHTLPHIDFIGLAYP